MTRTNQPFTTEKIDEFNPKCPLLQSPTCLRTLVEPDLSQVPNTHLLGFEDNQFKKKHVDMHDQVISISKTLADKGDNKDEYLLQKANQIKKKR